MQGGGWTKVLSKRPDFKWDVFPFGGRNRGPGLEAVTSFFVSEFPDFVNAKNLFELFGCSGRIVEVAISPRKTRFGKRFAFARFLDVVDGRALAIRLDNIMFEGKKIHVNLPRFDRSKEAGVGKSISYSSQGKIVNQSYGGYYGKSAGLVKGGNSSTYAEVVALKGGNSATRKEDVAWLYFQSDPSLKSRFDRAYVGRVCVPGSALNIQTHFEMEGIFSIKVTPIGGNCCLLEDLEEGYISDLIKEGESWWRTWFASIEKWEPGIVDGCRDVWLRIYGVPLHAWSSEFFVALGEKWGRFVCIDDHTAKGVEFDVARVLVNTPISLIFPDFVIIDIDGAQFKLRIREDTQCDYRPVNGLMKEDSSEDSSSESESDIPLLYDSEESSKSKDSAIRSDGCDVLRKTDVEVPILSPVGNLTGGRVHGVKDLVEEVNGGEDRLTVDQLCRSGIGTLGVNSAKIFRDKLFKAGTSDCAILSRSKGSSTPSSRDVVGSGLVAGDSTAETHSSGSSFAIKGNSSAGLAAGCCKSKDNNNVVVIDREFTENLAHVVDDKEEVSKDIFLKPASPCNSCNEGDRKQSVKSVRNPECNVVLELSGDSFVSDTADSREHLLQVSGVGSGAVASPFPGIEGTNRKPVFTGCVRISSVVGDLPASPSYAAPNSISKECSSYGGGFDIPVVSSGSCKLLPGCSDCGLPVRGSVVPVQYASPVSGSKMLTGSVFKGRSEGKKIKRVNLNSNSRSKGKGVQKLSLPIDLKMKGSYSCDNSAGRDNSNSGGSLHCYGEHSENSDICRNNNRQWEFLKRDVGERLWEAMLALGVVDLGRSQSLHMVEASSSGGKKDVKNPDQ